jgi:hypothetical protein
VSESKGSETNALYVKRNFAIKQKKISSHFISRGSVMRKYIIPNCKSMSARLFARNNRLEMDSEALISQLDFQDAQQEDNRVVSINERSNETSLAVHSSDFESEKFRCTHQDAFHRRGGKLSIIV